MGEKKEIIVGKEYKYGDICEILGENQYHGNQKVAQLKRWSLEYDIEKAPGRGNYLIKEIYKTPIDKDELRGRKNQYATAIGHILLLLCYDNKNTGELGIESEYRKKHPRFDGTDDETSNYYEFTASKSQLYVLLGLCKEAFINQAYKNNHSVIEQISEYPKLFQIFQDEVFGQCKNILTSARKTMMNRALINSHETIEFAYNVGGEKLWEWRVATVEEENNLITCRRNAMKEIGCVDEVEVYRRGLEEEFREKTIDLMREEFDPDIVSYRKSITFWAEKCVVDEFVGSVMAGREGDILKIKDEITNNAMLDNNEKFVKWLDDRRDYDWYTLNNDYVSKRQELGQARQGNDWRKWDDVLVELYQGDVESAWLHNICTNPNDENDEYYGGEIKEKYMMLRDAMKTKYVSFGRSALPGRKLYGEQ